MAKAQSLLLPLFLIISAFAFSQELYTARGYWEEANKESYRKLVQKREVGDSLTVNERAYIKDYEIYLASYFNRLSDDEKLKYEQMKPEWDREYLVRTKPETVPEEFEWRARDRFVTALYGGYYGASLVAIADIENAAAAGIPLISAGLWLMGPVFNPKRYEGITRTTIRASNAGKFLGLIYGASLALAISGDSENSGKLALGLSTVGSITLGEIAFQQQKKRNYSDGHVEVMRYYGLMGPWIATSILISTESTNANVLGATLLAGGVGGLLIGNSVSSRYDYTRGDIDAVRSFSLITTGLSFALIAENLDNTETTGSIILIPAATTVAATIFGQKAVKGVYLTKKQGSSINLSSAGAALIGVGIMALTESDSPGLWIAVPSGFALITHQLLFHKYKRDNLLGGAEGRNRRNHNFKFSMNVTPENYILNQKMPVREYNPRTNAQVSNPLVTLKLTF